MTDAAVDTGPDISPALNDDRPVSSTRRYLRRFRHQRAGVAAAVFLILLIGVVVFAPLLATHDPLKNNLRDVLAPPSGDHWLGTDGLGRDQFSRLLHGGRVSLQAATLAVLVGSVLGVLPGFLAGFFGGWVDRVISLFADAIMSFPALLLAIGIVGLLGPGLTNAMIAIGIVFAPRFLRLVRASVFEVREETYVEAARTIGCSNTSIVFRHILPNVLSPLIIQLSFAAGLAMLAEAGLSFLGLGIQPPDASWGSMLREGFRNASRAPEQSIFPGIAIMLSVLAFNVLGDGLRACVGRGDRSRP